MTIATPYYLIDEQRMLPAMEKIRYVEQHSGVKSVLALKCFSSWCAFDFMSTYMAGTTSSSPYEARLGHETFAGENHGYAVAYSEDDIQQVVKLCNKVIFNSISQLTRFQQYCAATSVGLRLNPEIGFSEHRLSDTVGQYSRLGVRAEQLNGNIVQALSGVMFHINCDNADFGRFKEQLLAIEKKFGDLLQKLSWVSLGGGVAFTNRDYPLDDFIACLSTFSDKFNIQVYLEPGEAAVTDSTSLVVTVLDIVDNGLPTLIVDAGVETHLLDVLTYDYTPDLLGAQAISPDNIDAALTAGETIYRVCGRTCLAGDTFGHYIFQQSVALGSQLVFSNTGAYSMVKKNFFNGIAMPSICYKNLEGETTIVREFDYSDFKNALSY